MHLAQLFIQLVRVRVRASVCASKRPRGWVCGSRTNVARVSGRKRNENRADFGRFRWSPEDRAFRNVTCEARECANEIQQDSERYRLGVVRQQLHLKGIGSVSQCSDLALGHRFSVQIEFRLMLKR